jgi:anaerobic selenocysteine-containing dehydrogenase/Fe-S-cluster-containing dehydrogenase component
MDMNRRDFLKIIGIGGGTAAMVGCSAQPPETLIPYVVPPEEIIPGQATWYATVCRECPAGCGMLVKTMEGRAIKVEGNPDHPVNRGRLCARGQASLQGLYNPDRIRQPARKGPDGTWGSISWEEGEQLLAARLAGLKGQGSRVAFVTPLLTGSLDRLIEAWLQALGGGRRLRYEAVSLESLREANRIAFGISAIPFYDLEQAELILSFGADFLETWLSPVEHARQFASTRTYRDGRMARFAYIGPRLSLTGANADEWIAARPGTEAFVALGMMHVILAEGLVTSVSASERPALQKLVAMWTPSAVADKAGVPADKIRVLARAFASSRSSLALADGRTSNGTDTCLAVNLLNYVVGNIGRTVRFGPTASAGQVSTYGEMRNLLEAMEAGQVSILLLSGVNPVFTLPEGERFRKALERVSLVVSFASFPDETANASHLILPDHTFLESWGDYEPWEGVHGLQQPAMRPLYDTRALGDLILSLAKRIGLQHQFPWEDASAHLRQQWKELHHQAKSGDDFETFWTGALLRGGLFQPPSSRSVRLNPAALGRQFIAPAFVGGPDALTLVPYASPVFYDGRTANRPWLQELPDALTEFVWDSWLDIHPDDARRLAVKAGDLLQVESPHGRMELPAHLSRGVRPGTVAVPLGQGHTTFGRYAEGRGANPIPLLSPEPEAFSAGLPWIATRVRVTPTGRRHPLVTTTGSDRSHDRHIIQTTTLADLQRDQHVEGRPHFLQMYPEHAHPVHRWGMAIDLNACIGCGACVAACYAENNIPVVGKEEVAKGREMSWIRIQRVDEGQSGHPAHRFLPMLCQQCDNAPCESVCPVYATYHNPAGLNVQVYNRCVGTRYCSNNCPYKVRRFNFWTAQWPEPLPLQLNPDVTVRTMGVMEKCTFCVQRIQAGTLQAKAEGRPVRDGEIVPACAQTCPTRAIVFGDLKDPNSEVSRLSKDPRRYRVLEDLNTQPAITYLKKITAGPVEG